MAVAPGLGSCTWRVPGPVQDAIQELLAADLGRARAKFATCMVRELAGCAAEFQFAPRSAGRRLLAQQRNIRGALGGPAGGQAEVVAAAAQGVLQGFEALNTNGWVKPAGGVAALLVCVCVCVHVRMCMCLPSLKASIL